MNPEDAEEYTQALGQVVAGGYRQVALGERLGVPTALGMSTREWVEKRLGGYVRMSVRELKDAAKELREDGLEQQQIAEILGVSQPTVSRHLAPARTPTPDTSPPHADEYEGAAAPSLDQHSQEPDTSPPHADEYEGAAESLPALPEGQEKADGFLAEIDRQIFNEPPAPGPHVCVFVGGQSCACGREKPAAPSPPRHVNEGDEWYTPRWLFDALGIKYAVDVCAPLDQMFSSVPAERVFTIEDDGLAQPWDGTVWCNPPYSKPEPWARRMIHHGDGLLLTHMPMNAGWCVDVWETCDAIRLFQAMEFVRPDGTSQRPGYWLQLAAFGPVATDALGRLQPLGAAAENKRRVASPMWTRAA